MVGGYEQLSKRLYVTKTEVKDWAAGSGAPGTMTFLLLLDLIDAETKKLSHEAMAMGLAEAVIAKAQCQFRV